MFHGYLFVIELRYATSLFFFILLDPLKALALWVPKTARTHARTWFVSRGNALWLGLVQFATNNSKRWGKETRQSTQSRGVKFWARLSNNFMAHIKVGWSTSWQKLCACRRTSYLHMRISSGELLHIYSSHDSIEQWCLAILTSHVITSLPLQGRELCPSVAMPNSNLKNDPTRWHTVTYIIIIIGLILFYEHSLMHLFLAFEIL